MGDADGGLGNEGAGDGLLLCAPFSYKDDLVRAVCPEDEEGEGEGQADAEEQVVLGAGESRAAT